MIKTKKYCILQNKDGMFLSTITSSKIGEHIDLNSSKVGFCFEPELASRCDYKDKDSEFLKKIADLHDLEIKTLEVIFKIETIKGEKKLEQN